MEHARWQGLDYEKGNLIFWHFFTGRESVSVSVPAATLLGKWVEYDKLAPQECLTLSICSGAHCLGVAKYAADSICERDCASLSGICPAASGQF